MESIYENYNAKPVCLAFEWTHNVLPFLSIENWFKLFENQIIYGHKLLLQSNVTLRNGSLKLNHSWRAFVYGWMPPKMKAILHNNDKYWRERNKGYDNHNRETH